MMMRHNKCGGPVLLDQMYKGDNFIDLSCMMCGKRWHISKKNPLARYVMQNG